mgnify:CR=1|tara:strand:+ start:2988 stop:3245 length:258 start_codon:yes stop_codon:yes gene_type:complete
MTPNKIYRNCGSGNNPASVNALRKNTRTFYVMFERRDDLGNGIGWQSIYGPYHYAVASRKSEQCKVDGFVTFVGSELDRIFWQNH